MTREAYSTETRKRILEAATKMFSEAGYRGTGIRQIVAVAGTNLASVNYHFGSKAALYRAAVEAVLADHPMGVGDTLDGLVVDARTCSHVRMFAIRRIRAALRMKDHRPPPLMGWEIVSPALDMPALMEQHLLATERQVAVLLAPMFDAAAPPEQRSFATRWFLQATMPPPPIAAALQRLADKGAAGAVADEAKLDAAAGRLADAALAGVRALAATPAEAVPVDPGQADCGEPDPG